MNNDNEQLIDRLKEMARLSVLSNRISDIQEKNLKMLPLILFNDVKTVKVVYDLSHNKTMDDVPAIANSIVSYHLTVEGEKDKDTLEKRFKALEQGVRNLFWSNVIVEIFFNEKIVYKSILNG